MSMLAREEERRLAESQAAARNAQMAEAARQDQLAWDRNREMFERNLQQQEQSRRMSETSNAGSLGKMKYGVLSGLLGKMGGSSGFGFGPQMATPGFSWSSGHMYTTRSPASRKVGPPSGGSEYEKQ